MRIKHLKNGFRTLTLEKARLIAHLIGDGCVYRCKTNYNIKYEVKDIELLQQFEEDLIAVYGLKPLKGFKASGKTGLPIPFVLLRAKLAFEDLLSYCPYNSRDWCVPSEISGGSKAIKKEFLKALFDDEGTVVHEGRGKIVRLYSINEQGLRSIMTLLLEFGINGKMVPGYGCKRNVWGLVIRNALLFRTEIGFNLERKQRKLEEERTHPSSLSPPSQTVEALLPKEAFRTGDPSVPAVYLSSRA